VNIRRAAYPRRRRGRSPVTRSKQGEPVDETKRLFERHTRISARTEASREVPQRLTVRFGGEGLAFRSFNA